MPQNEWAFSTRLMSRNPTLILLAFIAAGCLLGGTAHAAPLNYATAESISLSSPATVLTIATGTVADVLQVNATSVVKKTCWGHGRFIKHTLDRQSLL